MSNAVVEIASPVADTIFINGKVITVNSKDEIAEALATRGDRILRVGSRPYVEQTISHNTKVIDLTGRAMIPGLIDNHIHMTNSPQRHWVDCTYSTSPSIAGICREDCRESPGDKKRMSHCARGDPSFYLQRGLTLHLKRGIEGLWKKENSRIWLSCPMTSLQSRSAKSGS